MRIIGYILLILGCILLVSKSFNNSVEPDPIWKYFDKNYADEKAYSAADVRLAYRKMMSDYRRYNSRRQFLDILLPTGLVLFSGIILDKSKKS